MTRKNSQYRKSEFVKNRPGTNLNYPVAFPLFTRAGRARIMGKRKGPENSPDLLNSRIAGRSLPVARQISGIIDPVNHRDMTARRTKHPPDHRLAASDPVRLSIFDPIT